MKRKRHRKNGGAHDGIGSNGAPTRINESIAIQNGRVTNNEHSRSSNGDVRINQMPKKQKSESLVSKPIVTSLSGMNYITISDGFIYHDLLKEHYVGFSYIPANQVSNMLLPNGNARSDSFHSESQRTLEALREAGYYQYDIVMAGGQHLSRTFVQRTLVGDPGLTYKYLGLRLFTHAWSNDINTEGPRNPMAAVSPLFRNVYNLNQAMMAMTRSEVQKYEEQTGKEVPRKFYDYNLTLINYMESYNETVLRDEEFYGMGKASVSWHADSSLQDYSCIGVYHILPAERSKSNSHASDWKIALRPNPPTEPKHHHHQPKTTKTTTAPPVVVSTKSGDVYFLLHEFNHTHQHMVLAGSSGRRISSTHRVAVTETDTYAYIANRCSKALLSSKAELKKPSVIDWDVAVLLDAQAVLTEVEFEWIAQYWIQGAQHDVQHVWWQGPMRALEQAWQALEKVTWRVYSKIIPASGGAQELPPRDLVQGLWSALHARQEWRMKWDNRRADKTYKRRIAPPYHPVERPMFQEAHSKKQLPKDLTDCVHALSNVLSTAYATVPTSKSEPVAKVHLGKRPSNRNCKFN